MKRAGPALAAALVLAGTAGAAEIFAGAFAHDVDLGLTACCSEDGTDFQIGARTGPLGRFLGGELHAYALASVNAGDGVAFGAAGLLIRYELTPALYLQPGLGAAIHDGPGEKFQATGDRLYFGSRVLFQPELSLGWSISAPPSSPAARTPAWTISACAWCGASASRLLLWSALRRTDACAPDPAPTMRARPRRYSRPAGPRR